MRILCVHIETSSLWAEFVNKNRCISVRLVSEEVKALNFDNFDNSHNSFLWPEYVIDYLCERWIPCQASTSVFCLHYRSVTVHCSTKDAYTSEITFLALNPWVLLCKMSVLSYLCTQPTKPHESRYVHVYKVIVFIRRFFLSCINTFYFSNYLCVY